MNVRAWRQGLIGAHTVESGHMHSVAWSQGLVGIFIALLGGTWILAKSGELFDTEAWEPFVAFISGNKLIPGWMLLMGGVLGVLGLVLRSRTISLFSAGVCAFWCAWLGAFLWTANFQGEPNVGSIFALLAFNGYIHRFWLLFQRPRSGEKVGRGW